MDHNEHLRPLRESVPRRAQRRGFPNPPSVRGLTVPSIDHLFRTVIAPAKLLRFFSDFELVSGASQVKPSTPSPFMYGVEPTWREIAQHLDVERKENQALLTWAQAWLNRPDPKKRAAVVFEQPATGKARCLGESVMISPRSAKLFSVYEHCPESTPIRLVIVWRSWPDQRFC